MHWRGPPPNGKYANRGRAATPSGGNRPGSNRSGSGHPLAGLLVLRRQEHREEVGLVASGLAAIGDEPIDDRFELAERAAESEVGGERQPRLELRRPEGLPDALIDDRPGAVDSLRGRAGI